MKNALPVAANKAWLAIPASVTANVKAIKLVFEDGTTGISEANGISGMTGTWYDLNGRKLNKKPTTKGVYIFNGKKVAVK